MKVILLVNARVEGVREVVSAGTEITVDDANGKRMVKDGLARLPDAAQAEASEIVAENGTVSFVDPDKVKTKTSKRGKTSKTVESAVEEEEEY